MFNFFYVFGGLAEMPQNQATDRKSETNSKYSKVLRYMYFLLLFACLVTVSKLNIDLVFPNSLSL